MPSPRLLVSQIITLYQKTISRDHGLLSYFYPYGYCRFYPSCSEYSRLAILKYGIVAGCVRAMLRIIKCNPFSEPRVDMVQDL